MVFQALVSSKDDRQIRSLVDRIFASVDSNGSGFWEFNELKAMLMHLNRSQNGKPNDEFAARQIFNHIDTDGDGVISKQEFLSYILQNRHNTGFFQSSST